MRYAIKITAVVSAPSDAAAAKAAAEMKKLLANPMLRMLLSSSGVELASYDVDPKPQKV